MTYKETLTNIMTEMSKDSNTVFIGQQIIYAGNPMSTTLGNVPKEMMIEVPVMEETQMGMTLGLSMLGKKVVTFYPRWDFIISAANQLINHVDKYELMTEQKPHIIVRVGKGSDTPLDPGHQHKANYIEEFKSMCKTIKIFDCKSPKEIKEAYHFANNNKGVYIINEYPEKYNDYGVLNIICDESSDYSNTNKIQNIFGDGWYEITNYEICDRSQITLRKNENFYHIIVINTYISSVYIENPILPVSEEIKQLMRENKNLYTIFLTEHECETGDVIDVIDYGIKNVESVTYDVQRTGISLERIGRIPMPMDILVEYTDGTEESFYIPLRMMSFEKENPYPEIKRTVLSDWAWANPNYFFEVPKAKTSIKKITIDPSGLMADVKKDNNVYEVK